MATNKTQKTKATKKVEKAVKETTSKIKTAVKSVAKEAEKVVSKVATKTATAKTAAKAAVKTAAKKTTAAAKTAVKAAAKPAAKAPVKAAAKSAPKASEQTDVKTKASARKTTEKVAAVKAAAKPVTKTASMAQNYDPEYLVLMQKDPNWMQAFWDVSEDRIKRAKKGKGKLVLRLFDVSGDLTVKRGKKRKFHDVVVPADARSWYVENKATDNTVAVLGFAEGKNFMPLVESVPVQSYSPEGSSVNVDDVFVKASLGGATLGGFGSSGLSSMSAKTWLEQMANGLSSSSGSMFSGALSSAALKSNKLELPKDSVNYGKDFFLWVKTRLIVYGGTRPDAHLQVRGEPFPLNPDGTFSFEEDLPDSTKIIPVFATDKDGDFPTTIVPIVVKRTE